MPELKLSKPLPVRFPEPLIEKIEEMSGTTQLSKQELIRFSVSIGLAVIEMTGTDIPAQLAEKALKLEGRK